MSGAGAARPTLQDLAEAAGLAPRWIDYRGQQCLVPDDALRTILAAMGVPARDRGDIAAGVEHFAAEARTRPPMLTAMAGTPVILPGAVLPGAALPGASGKGRLYLEDGRVLDLVVKPGAGAFRAPRTIGYHRLELGDDTMILAVAPARALRIRDLTGARKAWGAALQLYSLNRGGDFGDFGDLTEFMRQMAGHGAAAAVISPTHALFSADLERYAPYGPSTRLFLNPLYADALQARPPLDATLIDWPVGAKLKMAALGQAYDGFRRSGENRSAFDGFVRAGGALLLAHARFEALDARFRPGGFGHWRDWPDGYARSDSAPVAALAAEHPEIEFHLFLQWRASASAAAAQAAAKAAGMPIGVIGDLAIGMDGAGSHAWSRPTEILQGIGIGAPPDLLAPQGQAWGLTTFSPAALRRTGYAPFLDTIRAALRHAGGVRIDHAIGLQHLWVVPDGAGPAAGAYLTYPCDDLLRLIALESHRHGAIVIGEDLGTVPRGFRAKTNRAGIAGMRVLWFERTAQGAFSIPSRWGRNAAAMTTTHDLPTIAGWWCGRDLEWRTRLGWEPDPERAKADRTKQAHGLWHAMAKSGAAAGPPPAPDQTPIAVDAAIAHVSGSDCDLAIIALEDIIGLEEQPNLPGLSAPHPNWRRRLPPGNGLDAPAALRRLQRLGIDRGRVP
jgi:4-alpha-glucanotransferase